MRLFSILFLLVGCSCFSQPLTLTIDSITSSDSIQEERKFKLKYLIKNNTSDTLKMFFKSNGYPSSLKNSISNISYYKIYENDTFIDIGSIFTTKGHLISDFSVREGDSIKTTEAVEKMYVEYLSKRYKTELDSLNKIYQEEGFESLLKFEGQKYYDLQKKRKLECQILNPNEQLEFFIEFNWDKNRYIYRDPNEYYLAENAKYYMEITLVALKEELQDKIDETVYKKLKKDPNFIKGVFVSNKVEINFKPN
jgi:hypothetical protein